MTDLLTNLNEQQRQAVEHTEGPLLILAGAGSGKTRVITHRIAYLIEKKHINPGNILAFTFTNKAAAEMKQRIINLVDEKAGDIWIGTFHATCVRILRRDIEKIGYDRNFLIFDTDDQLTLVKECIRDLGVNESNFPPRLVLHEIGRAKDELVEPSAFIKQHESDYRMSKIGGIYAEYQKRLKQNNALDFDDIIMLTLRLFVDFPPVLSYYQRKFMYIHVDEYQDTNTAQYHLISLLAGGYRNLCVVGDDDQSIYSFRGANIRNILDFEKEFPDCRVIKLEQNYRSTKTILNAANAVIQNNAGRKSKMLWTHNDEGSRLYVHQAENEHDEAAIVANIIKTLKRKGEFDFKDVAVLYRTNAQSRVIEDIFRQEGIPYKILAGTSFYQRREIKDVLSYLRLINNPESNVDLKRIINVPKRGIGAATIEKIETLAEKNDASMYNVILHAESYGELSKAAGKIKDFVKLIESFRERKGCMDISTLMKAVITETGIIDELEAQGTVEAKNRIENIKELVSLGMEFDARYREEMPEDADALEEFLAGISLVSDQDSIDEENSVLLMTIHSAKGLEFPLVFLVGMEEGIFPSYRSALDETELEEERRLCYVAITRAKDRLYITWSKYRTLYGKTDYNPPSRFIKEIPVELTQGIFDDFIANKPRSGIETKQDMFGGAVLFRGGKPITLNDLKKPAAGSYKVGDRVRHKKFGDGVIVSVSKDEDDYKLEINFDLYGMKRLLAGYANLQILK